MVTHVVLFRLNEDTTNQVKQDLIDALLGMETEIPEIQSLRVVSNIGRTSNFDLALFAEFNDMSAYERYGPHVAHQTVIETLIRPNVQEMASIQF